MIGHNLQFSNNEFQVDKLNAEFYGKIRFPWPPRSFDKILRNNFWNKMLAQDIGFWNKEVLSKDSTIWVAGCGTNQALFTALKFPDCHIIGSDLSKESLEQCKKNAFQLNIHNLELRNESINEAAYKEEFDYVICTGVIHHNHNPTASLQKLATAMKPSGIMELMVYNMFHRVATASFQLAARILAHSENAPNLDKELPIAKMIVNCYKGKNNNMKELLDSMKHMPDAAFADALLQPVENSYTIESLNNMSGECGLTLLHFCQDQFSHSSKNFDWNLRFDNNELQDLYDELSDIKRWHITNLLQCENSPMLWFYLQRKDCPRVRKTEKEICHDFLCQKFKPVNEAKELFILNDSGEYEQQSLGVNFPAKNTLLLKEGKEILSKLCDDKSMYQIFEMCGISTNFSKANLIRSCLATSGSPYLEAIA